MSCCTKISEFLGLGTFPSLHTTYIKLYPDLVPGILAFYNPGIFLSRRFWSRDLTPIKECVMIRYLLGPIYFYHTLEKKICNPFRYLHWLWFMMTRYHRNATHVDILFVLFDIWRFLHLLHDVELWKVSLCSSLNQFLTKRGDLGGREIHPNIWRGGHRYPHSKWKMQ